MLGEQGVAITNKNDILNEIDRLLRSSAPSIEFLFCENAMTDQYNSLNFARFGHALVRYTLPCGKQFVMNIVGRESDQMVNFLPPHEYLFGTENFENGAVQGGIYNRSYCGIRIEKVSPQAIEALHEYYQSLGKRQTSLNSVGFQLFGARVRNFILPWNEQNYELGNCSYWTSSGLVVSGILPSSCKTIFPKNCLVNIFEKYYYEDPSNVHVVYYHEVPHAKKYHNGYTSTNSYLSPIKILRNLYYYDLTQLADIIVEVPQNGTKATLKVQKGKRPPNHIFYRINLLLGILFCVYVLLRSEYWEFDFNNGFTRLIFLVVLFFVMPWRL